MSSNLDSLSRIGGAAQGGSTKPRQEREQMDRENRQRQEEHKPSGAEESTRQPGTVGGNSNDNRTDEQRSWDVRGN